MVSFNLEDFLQ